MSLARFRIAARLFAVAALAALTAGCFQPMYAERADGTPGLREKLMGVEVPPVNKANASREARVLVEIRNALAFKLYGNATGMPPTHKLVLRFGTSRSSLMLDPAIPREFDHEALACYLSFHVPGPTARISTTVSISSSRSRSGLCTDRTKSSIVLGSARSRLKAVALISK